ncbi:MAG: hypothetical protein WA981_06350 [Glaciecola sp.]
MNIDLVLMFGSLILLAVSGLLVFCFTESKGKNTPYARRQRGNVKSTMQQSNEQVRHPSTPITMDKELV